MGSWAYSVLTVAVAAVLLAWTGWWRLGFVVFTIRPGRMTVDRLGLAVESPEDVTRVNTLLRSFIGGFNAAITRPSIRASRAYGDSLPVLYRPFAEEGQAMGYTLRRLFRYDPAEFEREIVRPRPEFRYLHYVGLGFWSGMRNHDPRRLERIVEGLDPLHRYLCYDGFGFKHAFFDYPKDPGALGRLDSLEGYARNAAFQGVGRALWFLYMDRPDVLAVHAGRLGEYAADAAAGMGLASVFVFPDRIEVAQGLARELPAEWRDHFHLGMCFALKARSINDMEQLGRDMARLSRPVREAAQASIRECDRVELQVRAQVQVDPYRCWRDRVMAWMADNIEYPLAGVRAGSLPAPAVSTPGNARLSRQQGS